MASLDVIALDPTVPQLRAPGVGDTYHFCRVVEFQDGTDAAPSITNVGDTNTGIYWPNADELAVSTGGVQRMSLGATTVFNETGADVDFRIEGDTDANLVFVDASTDRVGLGLNNPDRLLDVDGSSKFRGQILITSGEALGLGLQALQLPTGVESTIGAGLSTRTGVAGESIIQFGNNMNTYYTGSVNAAKAGAMIRIDTRGVEPTPGASAYSVFQIQTRAAGVADPNYTVPVQIGAAPQGTFCIQTNGLATFNYGFVVNEGGGDYDTRFEGDTDTHLFFADASTDRIGIGTNAPGYKLDVNGTANFANNVTFTGGTANGVLYLNGSKVATSGSALTFDGSGTFTVGSDAVATVFNAPGDVVQYVVDSNGTGSTASHQWKYGSTEAMRLNSTGLGIGTSSPAARLDVVTGTARWNISNDGSGNIVEQFLDSTGAAYRNLNSYALNHILYTSGSERMRLDSSGNLGIGTSSPAVKLDIAGASTTQVRVQMSGQADVRLLSDTGTGITGTYSNHPFTIKTNSADVMSLTAAGNVGIGTSSPAQKLHVSGSGTQYIRLTTTSGAELDTITTSTDTYFGSRTNHPLILQTNNAERARITAGGDVGIGTSSPAAKLHVVGENAILDRSGGDPYLAFYTSGSATNVNIYGGSSTGFRVFTGGSERLRVDTSGNLGLGVTPVAGYGTSFQIKQSGGATSAIIHQAIGTNNQRLDFLNNALPPAGAYTGTYDYTYTGASATNYRQEAGVHSWYTAATGTAGNTISFTQAMTLDASGRLLVGSTTAPSGGSAKLSLVGGSSTTQSSALQLTYNGGTYGGALIGAIEQGGGVQFYTFTGNVGSESYTERARITSGGYFKASNAGTYQGSTGSYHELRSSTVDENVVYVSHTNATTPIGITVKYTAASPNGTGSAFLYCADSTALRAEIRSNGGLANYQTNNVDLSDARTKNSVTPAASMWDKVGALEIVTYKYNDQTHDDVNLGVIAQQVESVEAAWVDNDGFGETPEGEEPLKTVYTKDIYFAAIKALQEAMARIEKLEAEMAALKGV